MRLDNATSLRRRLGSGDSAHTIAVFVDPDNGDEGAREVLQRLKKEHITEVKSLANPPVTRTIFHDFSPVTRTIFDEES